MTKDEALKSALEALECLKRDFDADQFEWGIADEAITAIKEALAQPEQEPVQYKCTVIDDAHPSGIPLEQWAKPQRTWVGLTDGEVADFASGLWPLAEKLVSDRLRAIEAKLKEKNT